MDWAKVKLTADDFERGTINVAKGTTLDTQKDGDTWTSHWRTKNLVKIDKAINIPIKSGYKYYLCFYDSSGTYINNCSFRSYAETIKKATVPCMAMVITKNDESPMEQTEISNALPGYIWTAGQPEFGKLKDGSVYTKGRNLLKNSKDLLFHSTDYSGTVKLEKGKITLLKATQLTDAYCISSFNQSISGFIPIIDIRNMTTVEEPLTLAIDLKVSGLVNGTVTFYGDVRMPRIEGNNVTLTSSENGKWIRAYSHVNNVQQRDRAIFVVVPLNVSETDVGATIEYRDPAIYFGDEEIPWSSAPEDVDNPTEAV